LEVKDNPIMAAMRLNKTAAEVSALLRKSTVTDLATNLRGESALHLAVDKQDLYKSIVEVISVKFIKQ
jgi:RNA binding exosome subunit